MVFRMAARPALVGWSALGAMLASLIACGASDATQPPPTTEAPRACTQEAKVCPDGTVVSLELEERNAAVARANLARAGLGDRVEVRVGPAADTLAAMVEAGVEPFDLVFLDADKGGYREYVDLLLDSTLLAPDAVIAVDNNPPVRDRALELGADYALDSRDPDFADTLAQATGGRGLDVAFDAVGLKVTFEQALNSLTVGGRLIGVGMSAESPTVGPTSMFGLTQRQVLGHLGYHNTDIETLAQLVSRGRLDLSRSISRVIPLEDIHDGIRILEHADGNPIRVLVAP